MTTFRVGDRVRVERDEVAYPPKGTWPRYRGKTGTVATVHRETFPDGRVYVEVGVQLTAEHKNTWFRPHELTATGHTTRRAPRSA